ncbi:unnamed protein product [Pylaiella littoralis]
MVSNPSWAVVRAAAAEALQDTVDKNTTLGQFMDKLAETLSVNYQEVKLYKASLKELIAQKTEDERSSNDTEDQDQDEEDQDGRSSQDGNEDTTEKDSRGMMALRAMAKAMDLHRSRKLFQGLKQMHGENAEVTLKDRLIDAGAQFKGYFPSVKEIAKARRKTETAKDLDGMDTCNVIQGSRRRGRSADDTAAVSPPNKKQRSVDTQEGGSEIECSEDDSAGSAYEEYEDEFQLSAQ